MRDATDAKSTPRRTATESVSEREAGVSRRACAVWRPPGRPCVRCPWSLATTPGEFPLSRYEALRATAGTPGREVPIGGPIFACHKTPDGREQPCAGWLAAVGSEHLGVRMAVVARRLDPSALSPGAGWPELFTDYDELIRAQAGPDSPVPAPDR